MFITGFKLELIYLSTKHFSFVVVFFIYFRNLSFIFVSIQRKSILILMSEGILATY